MQARMDPLVIGAVGGSGTRVFTRIAKHAGLFMGGHLDRQEDSRSMSRFYSEFASDYLATNGYLDDDRAERLSQNLAECLRKHLEGLPAADYPWGIKNPRSMLMLPFWHRCFPDMRFLHVIRDGRDMAYSDTDNQIRRHGRAVLGADLDLPRPERAMLWWARVNAMAADYGETELPQHYMRVRLEDICARPKRTIRSLYDFINAKGGMKQAIAEVEPPPSLGRWRQRPGAEVARLVALGGTALERFGYGSATSGSPRERDPANPTTARETVASTTGELTSPTLPRHHELL